MKKIACCSVLLILLSAGLCRAEGKIWAVLVGINQYEEAPALACCRNDVTSFRDLLVSAGADNNRILLMTDDAVDSQRRPTYAKMLSNVQRWFRDKQVGPEDTFFFYFSGHGITKEGQDYLMPMDASRSYLDKTGYSLSTLHDLVRECKAGKVVVILDACRNLAEGKSAVQKSGFGALVKGFTVESRADAKKIITIQSCSPDEISWEMPDKSRGVFSYYLLEGLRDPAKRSLSKLWSYVSEEVPAWARAKGKTDQTPMLQTNVADLQDFSLLPSATRIESPSQVIKSITYTAALVPGDVISVRMVGEAGGKGIFWFASAEGGKLRQQTMQENSTGIYEADYTVRPDDNLKGCGIVGSLTTAAGETFTMTAEGKIGGESAVVLGAPKITAPADGATVQSPVTIIGKVSAGADVRLTVTFAASVLGARFSGAVDDQIVKANGQGIFQSQPVELSTLFGGKDTVYTLKAVVIDADGTESDATVVKFRKK